ncbi:50S ribosomal protein L19 [Candidatus Roizmanbacteria bacterium RIFCSPHIGHO2_02_FULL_40_13b]|uniref:50S ribosomal protein L19 n=1 Tax=Candidatus Roizmanbacteria bacterium RIFCSPHIGHO2_01_FULL_39_24 TaxID=1802032 RepID=A0A1F7GFQ4_9BACT|nr:MAG: 50S ribosomal protein L19 [Candidatus Roizmanbacteria bacterium RIFCSPHIGHO2_01_FULL_39_24]OGK26414.1 MAG: 50S ribosomal protein L19 [Candidatus Roizmanbacteria bacterium RIFCSPHIGHO2_02_FULL_40_13b]OGK49026.1 MAG: 50S ribosomal protein L19 [Candidatus Roizmanbacteria bacterium RIFCSPLOWO2_01_FULL_40_32]OGK56725.1 MAG: 50S ribosomal protein L19 [Candidatus Roizmanbacteria bacterium RIFCSPLOWO2_02_FULL_39_8]
MANVITVKEISAHIGDTVKIHYLFKEGEKEKRQIFEGILMATSGMVENKMFTVRKMTKSKIGVERIFPINSPSIEKIEVAKKGSVRRSKIYFIRDMSEKDIRERLS